VRLFLPPGRGLITRLTLHALPSPGTQLLWPRPSAPIAWSGVFIIAPLYSGPLLLAVLAGAIAGFGGRATRWTTAALILSTLYLGFTLTGKQMAERRVEAVLTRNDLQAQQLFSTTTPFNSLLWRVLLVDGE